MNQRSCRSTIVLSIVVLTSLRCTSTVQPMTITHCRLSTCGLPTPVPGNAPLLSDPELWFSTGGILKKTLTAAPGRVDTLDKFPNPQNLFNGSYLPPVWYVKPGDHIDLTVQNDMDLRRFARAGRYTNIHYHGFNVPPNNFSGQTPTDSIYIVIPPKGQPYEYEFPIPRSHPVGSFWYHPHPHSASEPQVMGGMSGVIVVKGLLKMYYPELAAAMGDIPENDGTALSPSEKVFYLKDYVPSGQKCATKSVNGVAQGQMTVQPSTPQLWRFANAGANQFYNLQLVDSEGTPQTFYILAVDGNPTSGNAQSPSVCRPQGTTTVACPVATPSLQIPPGSRMDVIVQLPPGTYTLQDLGTTTGGDPNCPAQLVTISASGSAGQSFDLTTLTASPVAMTNRYTADALAHLPPCNPATVSTSFTENPFSIDSTVFDMDTVHETVTVPTTPQQPCVTTWTVANDGMETHVFHIHQVDFLVQDVSPVPSASDYGVFMANPGYQDTVTIPAGATATMLIPFTSDIAGYFVYHCHILNHEDLGMMANICVGTSDPSQKCESTTPAARATTHPHPRH